MDLGIAARRAIVMASSQGLGLACAIALAREGCAVIINGRSQERLDKAVAAIADATGSAATPVTGDVVTPEGRAALLAACPEPDILVTNNAGPSPGDLASFDEAAWLSAISQNMVAPLLMIRAVLPGMRARKFGRIVNITSAMVKSPRPGMELSTSARAGLTAACKALSVTAAPDNVTINNMLPERFDTERQVFMARRMMTQLGITFEEARARIVATIPAHRFGEPGEFGDMCAFLCSAQAGFVSGQNIQLDGGAYHGLI